MSRIDSFRDLVVWQKSVDLAVEIYRLTAGFPPDERFGLTNQLRRAAISVCSNIAEGSGRQTQKDRLHFLSVARGSAKEVESLIVVSQWLEFVPEDRGLTALGLTDEVGKMLTRMRQNLEKRV